MNQVEMDEPGKRVLLMGNEALARGAIEAGVNLVAGYPGTPSSEIIETLIGAAAHYPYYVEWSANEKVAFDMVAGAAILGARSLATMKNAGLNVAFDSLMTINYGGVKGGMVIIVCDDPDAHYSSNEQDSRPLAQAAEIPCFEPMDQQQAKDMVKEAFALSEALELPVMVRSVSRLSHGNGDVVLGEIRKKKRALGFNKHWKMPWRWNVYGPPGAVEKHRWLHSQLEKAKAYSDKTPFNTLQKSGQGASVSIVTAGLASAYVKEALPEINLKADVLHVGLSFPPPQEKIAALLSGARKIFVVEEGGSFILENSVRAMAQDLGVTAKIYGKDCNRLLPPWGELNTTMVKQALAQLAGKEVPAVPPERQAKKEQVKKLIAPRSSSLCAGCPHLGTYSALKSVLKKNKGAHIVNGDIGCYEQAGYGVFSNVISATEDDAKTYKTKSTYELLDTIYVMGSSLGMAQGQAKAGYKDGKPFVVAGDSTFFHALLPAVVNAIYNNSNVTLLVVDNKWTAMTGHQANPATGISSRGEPTPPMDILKIVQALGAPFVEEGDAFALDSLEDVLTRAARFQGFSVVVIRGECRLQVVRRAAKGELAGWAVDAETCTGCRLCIDIGCPALGFDAARKKAWIDLAMCNGCEICGQVCPSEAIAAEGGGK